MKRFAFLAVFAVATLAALLHATPVHAARIYGQSESDCQAGDDKTSYTGLFNIHYSCLSRTVPPDELKGSPQADGNCPSPVPGQLPDAILATGFGPICYQFNQSPTFGTGSTPGAPADVSSIYALICSKGGQPKQVNYGDALVVTCDNGDILPVGSTSGDIFGISITCKNSGEISYPSGFLPKQLVVKCADINGTPNGTLPSATISNGDPSAVSIKPDAAFQGDCNNGGVTVGVSIKGSDTCVGGNGVNPIYAYLRGIILFLSGIFGLLAVLMIIVSGIQYITSSGNPQAIEGAKKRLGNAILGIILFMLMFAILNYLIPGGVFG